MALRVAIVGLGRQGKRRLEHLQKMPASEVEVVSICDSDLDIMEGLQSWRVQRYTVLEAAIKDVDAVCICTNSTSHHDIARTCLLAGKHVLVEKPLALTKIDAYGLVYIAKSFGLGLHCGLNMRYRAPVLEAVRRLRERIGEGSFGEIEGMTGHICHGQFRNDMQGRRASTSGGPLLDIGTHVLDVFLSFLSYPQKVRPADKFKFYGKHGEGKQYLVKLYDTGPQIPIMVSASFEAAHQGVLTELVIKGDNRSLAVHMGEGRDIVRELPCGRKSSFVFTGSSWETVAEFSYPDDCWRLDCEAFLATCKDPSLSNGEQAARVVELLTS